MDASLYIAECKGHKVQWKRLRYLITPLRQAIFKSNETLNRVEV